MGYYDQRMAMQWVVDNARVFGGDPQRITVMGESAGATSLCHHLLSPTSIDATGESLFARVIIQSGAVLDPYTVSASPRQDALLAFQQTVTAAGCGTEEDNLLDDTMSRHDVMRCMRNMDVMVLRKRVFDGGVVTSPLGQSLLDDPKDNSSIVRTPSSIIRSGSFDKRIPVMIGWTSDEGS